MRPITVQVGPLAAPNATNIATAQRNYGTNGSLALIGTLSDKISGSVAASQSPGSGAILINGTNASNGIAYLGNSYIYLTSGGDDHAITFAIHGLDKNSTSINETVTGTNAQSVASANRYWQVLSITASGAVAGTLVVGSYTKATLDTPRRILFTTGADESANTVTVSGTDWAGNAIGETLALTNAGTSFTVLSYATVNQAIVASAAAGNIEAGTNQVADSPWVQFDPFSMAPGTVQCTVTGTVSYTLWTSNDDPNSPTNPILPQNVTWQDSVSPFVGASASGQAGFDAPFLWAKVTLTSETAATSYVVSTFVQFANSQY